MSQVYNSGDTTLIHESKASRHLGLQMSYDSGGGHHTAILLLAFQPEAVTACTGAAVSFIEVTIPALLVTVGEWSLRVRYMMAVIPVSSIIFLASFVPCLMATDIPVKFKDMVIIWVERMLLSVLITGIFAIILFP